jgi:two-component system response regulator VicR
MARILIVDDSEDLASALKLHFEARGHEALCAVNGRDALMLVLSQTPDVVLLDLAMPEMDGPSLLEVIRSYLRIQSLPVVVLTGLSESPMIDRVRTLHVNAILLKGKVTDDEVLQALEEACGRLPAA